MSIIETIRNKAASDIKRIVFPEGEEPRTVEAAAILHRQKLAEPVLIGSPVRIAAAAEAIGPSAADEIRRIRIEDPETSPKRAAYAERLYELRKDKGLTREEAEKQVTDPMVFGVMAVKLSDADGLVSGAVHTTGEMLRPALRIIRTKPGMKVVSSSFLMECPNRELGENGLMVYADCVVVPDPTAEELACIAVAAADTAKTLCGIREPRVAMLSFSTKGSAEHEMVSKVRRAVGLAHGMAPDLLLDGELQFDAAVIPEIGAVKAKDSPVAGRANVLVFPDLQAGNIGYKITQRVGGAQCFAVLQGLAKPCNDLSRGCSVEDIVNTAAMTAVQAQQC